MVDGKVYHKPKQRDGTTKIKKLSEAIPKSFGRLFLNAHLCAACANCLTALRWLRASFSLFFRLSKEFFSRTFVYMAIYHLRAGFVSRSSGRSAVQSAAYITGTLLEETRRDLIADYRNRSSDVIYSFTLAPDHAPESFRTLKIWDELENFEDRYAMLHYKTDNTQTQYKNSAQVAQTIVIALPQELSPEVWKELTLDFVTERFISRGLTVSGAIHTDKGNPHAHLQVSRRAIKIDGTWELKKDRSITTKSALLATRKLWAEKTNYYLAMEGFNLQVDHRSFVDLCIPFKPTRHQGWYANKLQEQGMSSRIVIENNQIRVQNKELTALTPEAILQELTTKYAVFTADDLAKLIQGRLADDVKLATVVYNQVFKQLVSVGENFAGKMYYTTPIYQAQEATVLGLVQQMATQKSGLIIDPVKRDEIISQQYSWLNAEQLASVKLLCDNYQLTALVGRAGTGKTTTLKAIVTIHKASGFKITGMALSAVAADNLGAETSCSAETIAFYLDRWEQLKEAKKEFWSAHTSQEHPLIAHKFHSLQQYELTNKHLVIVDEAGMVGTNAWGVLLQEITTAGAKLIKTGDDHQFKAIESGDFFRKSTELVSGQNKLAVLTKIVRQKEEWMREASQDLADQKIYRALALYENHGHVQKISGNLITTVANAYIKQITADSNGLLLVGTNAECQQLNTAIRTILQEQGLVAKQEVAINKKPFAIGDKIVFLKNDRTVKITSLDPDSKQIKELLIKNGMCGKIIRIEAAVDEYDQPDYRLTVAIDKHTNAQFLISDYNHINHGYALTLRKAQGQTVNWSMVVASKNMDAAAIYVALTRHRETTTLFYDSSTFKSFKELQQSLSKLATKELVTDFTIKPEHLSFWENVQCYKLLGQDLMAAVKEPDWESYQELKTTRETLGKTILANWPQHAHFAKQAGLSQEAIQIGCGLKMRPLSQAELIAKNEVDTYTKISLEARTLWNEIKVAGKFCMSHPKYHEFTLLREKRQLLAIAINNNQVLHKEFVTQNFNLGINWKAIKAQAAEHVEVKFKGVATTSFNQECKEKVYQYALKTLATQNLWQQIKEAGKNCKAHSLYPEFNKSRQERNNLALELGKEHVTPELQQGLLGVNYKIVQHHAQQQAFQYYKESSKAAQQIWNNIKHMQIYCKTHPDYEEFFQLRNQRNNFAQQLSNLIKKGRESQVEFNLGVNLEILEIHTKESFDYKKLTIIPTADDNKDLKAKVYQYALKSLELEKINTTKDSVSKEHQQLLIECRNLAQSIVEQSVSHPELLNGSYGISWKILASQTMDNNNIKHEPKEFKEFATIKEGQQSIINKGKKYDRHYAEPDFNAIRQQLNNNIAELAKELLGEPKSKTATEWRYGNKGSISVKVTGTNKGLYANFEKGINGGAFKLIEDCLNLNTKEAFKYGLAWLGGAEKISARSDTINYQAVTIKQPAWIPIFPIPLQAHNPDLTSYKLRYQLSNHDRHETARFAYKDAADNLLFYTIRLENQTGDKVVLPLTYCRNGCGREEWRWQGLAGNGRPLYGLDRLAAAPLKPVLVVEGEKTADVAQKLLPEMNVVSWPGGTGAVNKIDWSPLEGRQITLWPDNDTAGIKAMEQITKQLMVLGVSENDIHQVQLPSNTPAKWDLADNLPADWSMTTVRDLLKTSLNNELSHIEQILKIKEIAPKLDIQDHKNSILPKQAIKEEVDFSKQHTLENSQQGIREKNRSIEMVLNKIGSDQRQIVDRKETVVGIIGFPRKLSDGRKMHEIFEENNNQIKLITYNAKLDLKLEYGSKVIINTDDHGAVSNFDQYCNANNLNIEQQSVHMEHIGLSQQSSHNFISSVIEKYNLTRRVHNPKDILLENVQTIYQQMLSWNRFINNKLTDLEQQQLLEKAILTEILTQNAGKHCCFSGSLLSTHHHSQQSALIGAKLMQQNLENNQSQNIVNILEQSNDYYNRQELQKSFDIIKLTERYPDNTKLQISILTDQTCLCNNMINKTLTVEQQQAILTATKVFEKLKDCGKLNSTTHEIVNQQTPTINPETQITVDKMLEFKFMEQDRQKTNQTDHNKQLNPDKMLTESKNAVLQLHHSITRQQLLETQMKQKDKELER